VLAGDISSVPDQLVNFLQVCLSRFAQVIFVPGNHEYYRHDYFAWNAEMTDRIERFCPGLHYALGDVDTVEIDGVRYIYSTLWADGGPTLADRAKVSFYLNDFRLISYGKSPKQTAKMPFTAENMISIHKDQKAAIENLLTTKFDGRTVVITHHLPSRRLVSERFWPGDGSDGANGGFASDCDNMIAVHEPFMWIHGHTHDTIDTELWKTRIVCNPAGYRGEWATKHNMFMATPQNGSTHLRSAVTVPKFVDL
jgi:hypothetical protein